MVEFTVETRSELKNKFISALSSGLSVTEACSALRVTPVVINELRRHDSEFDKTIDAILMRIAPSASVEARLNKLFERGEADSSRYVKKITSDKVAKEICERIVDALSRGLTFEQACIYVSISPIEIREYAENNAWFFEALNEAEMRFSMFLIDKIMRSATNNWKAAAWLLERKFPEKFGVTKPLDIAKRAAIEKTTQIKDKKQMRGKVSVIEVESMTDEELKKALESAK